LWRCSGVRIGRVWFDPAKPFIFQNRWMGGACVVRGLAIGEEEEKKRQQQEEIESKRFPRQKPQQNKRKIQ